MVGDDSSRSRRPHVQLEDQDRRERPRRRPAFFALGRRRARHDAQEPDDAGDLRPQQRTDRPARDRRGDEGRIPALASIPTVGYASHVQTDVINAARQAGVGEVLARSAFVQQLADILTRTDRSDDDDRRASRAAADRAVHPSHAARALGLALRDRRRRGLAESGVAAALELVQVARRLQRGDRPARTSRRPPGTARHRIGRQSRTRPGGGGQNLRPAARRLHAGRRAARQARRHPPRQRRPPSRRPRLRRCGADGEGVCGEDRRGIHLAVQRSRRHRRRRHGRARDVRGRARSSTRWSYRLAAAD